MKKHPLVILFAGLFVVVFVAWFFFFDFFLGVLKVPLTPSTIYEVKGKYNENEYYVKYSDTIKIDIQKGIDSIITAVNTSISLSDSNSVISKFNRGDSCVFVDGVFLDLFLISDEVYECTDSAFDPTVYTISKLWGFGPDGSAQIDGLYRNMEDRDLRDSLVLDYIDAASAEMEEHMGYSKVRIGGDLLYNTMEEMNDKNMQDNFACKEDRALQMDFSALAKGYIVDKIYDYLLYKKKVSNFLVYVGGEVIASGTRPDGSSWTVEVDNPTKEKATKLGFKLNAEFPALAVCENYSKSKRVGKEVISATFDPRKHLPVENEMVAVIILGQECVKADAYATAFMVMGITESIDFVETNPFESFEAYFIYKNEKGEFKTYASPGLTEILANDGKSSAKQ
jgi:thiamine biosynthesis lipoprotein